MRGCISTEQRHIFIKEKFEKRLIDKVHSQNERQAYIFSNRTITGCVSTEP